jgi:hypothetical protein
MVAEDTLNRINVFISTGQNALSTIWGHHYRFAPKKLSHYSADATWRRRTE